MSDDLTKCEHCGYRTMRIDGTCSWCGRRTADELTYDVAYLFRTTEPGDDQLDTRNSVMLLNLIRAVVREELEKMQKRAEASQRQATQERWDSPEFKAQVDALCEGRPVITSVHCNCCAGPCRNNMPVADPTECCYSLGEVCPNHC